MSIFATTSTSVQLSDHSGWIPPRAMFHILLFLLTLLAIPSSPAFAGRLLATGHDADFHCGDHDLQCHYFEVAVRYVRGGAMNPSLPVLILDRGDTLHAELALDKAFPPAGSVPRLVVDPRSQAFKDLVLDPMKFSAIVIASDTTCGGCDLNEDDSTPDSDAINARAADFAAFFNGGGGIFALAGADHGDGTAADDVYYNFLPIPVGGAPVQGPFTLTPAGIALGFENPAQGVGTNNDINCFCQTHNSFTLPGAGSAIQVAELDSQGRAETIFAEGTIVDGEIVPPCVKPIRNRLRCATDGSGYVWDFLFRNLSGNPVEHIYFVDPPAGVTFEPNSFHFNPPIPPGGFRNVPNIKIKGAAPGPLTFKITLHTRDLEECCVFEYTLELPECDCAQFTRFASLNCFFLSPPPFTYSLAFDNLSSTTVSNVLLTPQTPTGGPLPGINVTPNVLSGLNLAPVPYTGGQGSKTQTIAITGPDAKGGKELCLNLSLHDALFQKCCSIERCFTLPNCFPPPWDHRGAATLAFFTDRLIVSGIGSSGDDGARVGLGEATDFRLGWLDLDPTGSLPTGALLRASATGSILGEARDLGSIEFTKELSKLELVADFSAIDSPTQRLEIYNEGELVTTVTGNAAPLAFTSGINVIVIWPRSISKIGGGGGTTCFVSEWDHPIEIAVPGAGTFQGDELRVLAENQEAPLDFIDSFSIQAARIPEIVLVEAEATYDCNHNGVPDSLDIEIGASFDFDADGVPDECQADQSLTVDLNTGFDQTSDTLLPVGTLPAGTEDDDWRLVSPAPERPAKVVINQSPQWAAALPQTRWLSVNPNRGISLPGVANLEFERCFCLAAGASDVQLDLQVRADDRAVVRLNGETLAGPGGGFRGAQPLAVQRGGVVGDGLFVAGENCLQIEVLDTGGVLTGFNLAGTLTSPDGACSR